MRTVKRAAQAWTNEDLDEAEKTIVRTKKAVWNEPALTLKMPKIDPRLIAIARGDVEPEKPPTIPAPSARMIHSPETSPPDVTIAGVTMARTVKYQADELSRALEAKREENRDEKRAEKTIAISIRPGVLTSSRYAQVHPIIQEQPSVDEDPFGGLILVGEGDADVEISDSTMQLDENDFLTSTDSLEVRDSWLDFHREPEPFSARNPPRR